MHAFYKATNGQSFHKKSCFKISVFSYLEILWKSPWDEIEWGWIRYSVNHKLSHSECFITQATCSIHTGTKPRASHQRAPAWVREAYRERQRSTIYLESTRQGQRPLQHWNCVKSNIGETSQRRGESVYHRLSRALRYYLELNGTERNRVPSK